MSQPHPVSRRTLLRSLLQASAGFAAGACTTESSGGARGVDAGDTGGDFTDVVATDTGGGGRPKAVVVGGGMAGVCTAWLLEADYDVVVLEAAALLGGNVQTITVDYRGSQVAIDMGAQYFHPGPYPTYVRLLEALGVYSAEGNVESFESPSTITLSGTAAGNPLFVSPLPPTRNWPSSESWNIAGVTAFALLAIEGPNLERDDAPYDIRLDDWLVSIGLSEDQRERLVIPWAASLYSGNIEQARGYSARAAMTFMSRALGDNGLQGVSYFTLVRGMGSVIDELAAQTTTARFETNAKVVSVVPEGTGYRVTREDGATELADVLIFAAPAPALTSLLTQLPEAAEQRDAIAAFEFHDARLVLHTDPIYSHADSNNWSFLNCLVDGEYCEGSMAMANAIAPLPSGEPVELWKSWAAHRSAEPAEILHETFFKHMVPSPATIAAQARLRAAQGVGNVYFVGGFTYPYDSQETALLSALAVADALAVASERRSGLA